MLDILEHMMTFQVMQHKHSSVVATTFIQRVSSKRLYVHGSLVGYLFFLTIELYENDFVNAAYLIFVLTIKSRYTRFTYAVKAKNEEIAAFN